MASQNMVPRLRFPKGADAIYIVDEYGRALPMKKSSKNPCIYYFHEKHFEPGYVSRRTAKEYSGWEYGVKELADILKKHNIPYKLVNKNTILIPYGSISITRLGKLYREFKYRKPYQIVLAVEYPDGETAKFSYLYKILSSLGKPEKIYTSKTDKKYSPIILKYPYYIIAIAPRTG